METNIAIADHLLTKEARSKMYEMFDQLSKANQARIGRAGMLRSENQVMSGIERGNQALIKKHNIPVHVGSELQKERGGYFSFGSTGLREEMKNMSPAQQRAVQQHPAGRYFQFGLHVPETTPSMKLNQPSAEEFFAKDLHGMGILKKPSDFKYAKPHIVRHEINEYLDKVNNARSFKWQGSKHAPALAPEVFQGPASKGTITHGIQDRGNHNSLGVLAKERKLAEGFSYTKGAQVMNQMREVTGENKLLSHIIGRNAATATLSKKEIQTLSNASPEQYGLRSTFKNQFFSPTNYENAWDIRRLNPGTRHQEDKVFAPSAKKQELADTKQKAYEVNTMFRDRNIGRPQKFWEKGRLQFQGEKEERQGRKLWRQWEKA